MIKKTKRKAMLVKPSSLPKDERVSLRINSKVKARLAAEDVSLQEVLDSALDAMVKIEIEETMTVDKKAKKNQ